MATQDESGVDFPTNMSLRDWFAGQALMAWPVTDRESTPIDLARKCYALADAMLNERGLVQQG